MTDGVDDLVATSCPGWPLVRGSSGLTESERAAGDAHAEWCASCRSRRAARERNHRLLVAAGTSTTVVVTGSGALLSLPTLAVALASTAVLGTSAVYVVDHRSPPAAEPRPSVSDAPQVVLPSARPAPAIPRPTDSRAAAPTVVSTSTSSAPAVTPRSLLPTAVPTITLPTALPTLLPVPTVLPTLVPLPTSLPTLRLP